MYCPMTKCRASKEAQNRNPSILVESLPLRRSASLQISSMVRTKRLNKIRVCKQPVIALYFEVETVLKFYNLWARPVTPKPFSTPEDCCAIRFN